MCSKKFRDKDVSWTFERRRKQRSAFDKKRNAFTLAEVLITLGIIGIIAAMTLPNLVADYKQKEMIVRAQKVYNTLNQALRLSVAKNGDVSGWSYDLEKDTPGYVAKYWEPYFLAVGGFKSSGYSPGLPFTTPNGQPYGFGTADGTGQSRIFFKFNDGSVVWVISGYASSCKEYGTDESGNEICIESEYVTQDATLAFDVNGLKGPNKVGSDFFRLEISTKGNLLVPKCHDKSNADVNNDCSMQGLGECCLEKLIRDGWEIKDDYPW